MRPQIVDLAIRLFNLLLSLVHGHVVEYIRVLAVVVGRTAVKNLQFQTQCAPVVADGDAGDGSMAAAERVRPRSARRHRVALAPRLQAKGVNEEVAFGAPVVVRPVRSQRRSRVHSDVELQVRAR